MRTLACCVNTARDHVRFNGDPLNTASFGNTVFGNTVPLSDTVFSTASSTPPRKRTITYEASVGLSRAVR